MSIVDDPLTSKQVEVDMTVRALMLSAMALNDFRRDNEGRRYIIDSVSDIELTRDRLSAIIDDVQGRRP